MVYGMMGEVGERGGEEGGEGEGEGEEGEEGGRGRGRVLACSFWDFVIHIPVAWGMGPGVVMVMKPSG